MDAEATLTAGSHQRPHQLPLRHRIDTSQWAGQQLGCLFLIELPEGECPLQPGQKHLHCSLRAKGDLIASHLNRDSPGGELSGQWSELVAPRAGHHRQLPPGTAVLQHSSTQSIGQMRHLGAGIVVDSHGHSGTGPRGSTR